MVTICFWYSKEIVRRSCSLNEVLWKNDSILVDQVFIISLYFENIRASVICQLFLNGCEQLTKAEVKES